MSIFRLLILLMISLRSPSFCQIPDLPSFAIFFITNLYKRNCFQIRVGTCTSSKIIQRTMNWLQGAWREHVQDSGVVVTVLCIQFFDCSSGRIVAFYFYFFWVLYFIKTSLFWIGSAPRINIFIMSELMFPSKRKSWVTFTCSWCSFSSM